MRLLPFALPLLGAAMVSTWRVPKVRRTGRPIVDGLQAINVFAGGSLNLGTTGYVTGTAPTSAVFGNATKCTGSSHCSAVAIDATDTVLTISLGDLKSGTVTSAAITNPGVTYSPNSAIVGADGVTVTGSATDSAGARRRWWYVGRAPRARSHAHAARRSARGARAPNRYARRG